MNRREHAISKKAGIVIALIGCATIVSAAQVRPLDTRIAALNARATAALQSYMKAGSAREADGAIRSIAALDAFAAYAKEKPEAKEIPSMFAVCSLSVESSVHQLDAAREARKIDALQKEINTTLTELSAVHDSILLHERSEASRLKTDLDAQQRAAEKLKQEAEHKFSELQSALIQVKKDARGTIISMSDILFDIGKATLTADLKTSLAKIAGILTVFKDSHIMVEGHTDNQGSAEYNQTLSEERALNVQNFLITQGVDPGRLKSIGYGFSKPIADNATKEGRQKNRRVDLVIQDVNQAQDAKPSTPETAPDEW
jgi:outer membrane protein OmpA-like peptidoglycan-associated protein